MPQSKRGIVVAANPIASRVGLSVLKKGGNAIDAAVATAQALGVANLAFSGIGGGGFALIWLAKEQKPVFIDYRERAPISASENMFQVNSSGKVVGNQNAEGYRAVAVPGTLTGHALMLERLGSMKLKELIQPAIDCARRGFQVRRTLAYVWKQKSTISKLKRSKASSSIYLRKSRPYRQGEKISLPDLKKSLEKIAANGYMEFYDGSIAAKICDDMKANNGLVTRADFQRYTPTLRNPLRGSYKGFDIISAPPPSVGPTIILQVLNMLETYSLKSYGHNSAQTLHLLAEVLARGNENCRTRVCDPDFAAVPMDLLVSKDFAREASKNMNPNAASFPSNPLPSMPASNTTHFVTADSEGNVVSMTESIECYFGSGVTVPGTGIILNDTMHDFDPQPKMANSVGPWKIPMSSMCPTIVLKDGRPILALGSAGGPRIVTSTLQALLNVTEFEMGVKEAVAAPRMHLDGDCIQLENSIPSAAVKELRKMGHKIQVKKPKDKSDPGLYFGGVHAAEFTEEGMRGGADPRRDGLAISLHET